MKNRASITARAGVAIASSILVLAWVSAGAADIEVASRSTAEFQALAGSDLLILGPVESVDPAKSQIQVLGQWIAHSNSQISQNTVGHVLAVYGSVKADGSFEVSAIREQSSIDYVPGANHLYLKAAVSAVDRVNATARIGALSISYSGALHSLVDEDLAVGAVASFSGLQYGANNKLYADNILVHQASTLGQTGSGLKASGQTGSGFQALGQTGSGIKASGQTGSGFQALGQTGSGLKASGQTGSGFQALGQTGSGLKASGQTGSGIKASGQTGSGFQAMGQTGSGSRPSGQTGSGFR